MYFNAVDKFGRPKWLLEAELMNNDIKVIDGVGAWILVVRPAIKIAKIKAIK